jgi:hypothetical protein
LYENAFQQEIFRLYASPRVIHAANISNREQKVRKTETIQISLETFAAESYESQPGNFEYQLS